MPINGITDICFNGKWFSENGIVTLFLLEILDLLVPFYLVFAYFHIYASYMYPHVFDRNIRTVAMYMHVFLFFIKNKL